MKQSRKPPLKREEEYLENSLPSSDESERVILGAILLDNLLAAEVFATLKPEDFYSPLNRRIAVAMVTLAKKGKQVDPITIGEELKKESSLDAIGGTTVITNLTFGLPHFNSLAEYIDVVRKKSLARIMIRTFNALVGEVLSEEDEPDELLSSAISQLTHLLTHRVKDKTQSLKQVTTTVLEMFNEWEAGNSIVSSVSTGIPELDGRLKLGGLAFGELTLIGARPSTGKTALMLQIATNVIRLGVPVLFISLEMLKEKLVMRMLPPITSIPNKAINPTTFQKLPEQAARLREALISISDLPLYFDRSFDLSQLLPVAEHYIQTKGVKLIVFDYLTLINDPNPGQNRDTEVGNVTNALKELGLRNHAAVLGAAQFNRESAREFRRPRMSDLRESGVIEQAADVILFPWDKDGKRHAENPEMIRDFLWLDLYCEKQRDGERGWTVPLRFDKDLQMMESPEMGAGAAPIITPSAPKDKPLPPAPRPYYEPKEPDDPEF